MHTNILEPFPTPAWNSQQYFMSFINDHSRYAYLFLIHENFRVLDVFKSFKVEVGNKLNKRIKIVKFDRGAEYYGRYDSSRKQCLGPFSKYLENVGSSYSTLCQDHLA